MKTIKGKNMKEPLLLDTYEKDNSGLLILSDAHSLKVFESWIDEIYKLIELSEIDLKKLKSKGKLSDADFDAVKLMKKLDPGLLDGYFKDHSKDIVEWSKKNGLLQLFSQSQKNLETNFLQSELDFSYLSKKQYKIINFYEQLELRVKDELKESEQKGNIHLINVIEKWTLLSAQFVNKGGDKYKISSSIMKEIDPYKKNLGEGVKKSEDVTKKLGNIKTYISAIDQIQDENYLSNIKEECISEKMKCFEKEIKHVSNIEDTQKDLEKELNEIVSVYDEKRLRFKSRQVVDENLSDVLVGLEKTLSMPETEKFKNKDYAEFKDKVLAKFICIYLEVNDKDQGEGGADDLNPALESIFKSQILTFDKKQLLEFKEFITQIQYKEYGFGEFGYMLNSCSAVFSFVVEKRLEELAEIPKASDDLYEKIRSEVRSCILQCIEECVSARKAREKRLQDMSSKRFSVFTRRNTKLESEIVADMAKLANQTMLLGEFLNKIDSHNSNELIKFIISILKPPGRETAMQSQLKSSLEDRLREIFPDHKNFVRIFESWSGEKSSKDSAPVQPESQPIMDSLPRSLSLS
jgi:hypothetical protein